METKLYDAIKHTMTSQGFAPRDIELHALVKAVMAVFNEQAPVVEETPVEPPKETKKSKKG